MVKKMKVMKEVEEVKPTPHKGAKKKKGATGWIAHVKKVAKEKGIKYGQALKVASKTYKKK